VIGEVDDRNRALVHLPIRQTPTSPGTSVTAWIDTAFDGHLVFPAPLIEELKLESLADTEAILADGRKVTLEAFSKLETGQRPNPTIDTLMRYAEAVGKRLVLTLADG
jgi:hypothetical protein